MKTLLATAVSMILAVIGLLATNVATAETTSLRGNHAVDSPSTKPQIMRWQEDKEPIKRDYVKQPPLVPHSIEGYRINLKVNKCLTCHSWANYKDAGATKISQTHFDDRDGQEMANVSPRRYFCTQCHVSQVDAKPLVENNFKPVQAITGK